ncbi:hypothetical protein [Arthrobacter sp. Br18]|uniref:hypothetical protein n=1 Tax=Arthrobacter sp. Br18 TaxID=1312954 RepID=UPI0004AE7503|nr:hypothetical protein [Arthrobacter sp. Br18]
METPHGELFRGEAFRGETFRGELVRGELVRGESWQGTVGFEPSASNCRRGTSGGELCGGEMSVVGGSVGVWQVGVESR